MSRRPVNQLTVSRVLGGIAVPGGRARFGHFPLLQTVGDTLKVRPELLPEIVFSDTDDDVIRKTFEKLRDGLAIDRFLADPVLAKRFNRLVHQYGVKHPPTQVNLRLLRMRKRAGGGSLEPTTRTDSRSGLIDLYGPAVEYALVQMRVRYGASVDDLLADAALGDEFEATARTVIDGGSPVDYRLCALHIRKSRHLSRTDRSLFDSIDARALVNESMDAGTIARPRLKAIPRAEGVVLLAEAGPERPLYVGRFADVHAGIETLHRSNLIQALRDSKLWSSSTAPIGLNVLGPDELGERPARVVELRLIQELEPTFNWPVKVSRAA